MLPLQKISAVRCHFVKNVLDVFCLSNILGNPPSIDKDLKNILTYNCQDFIFPCEYNESLPSCYEEVPYSGFVKVNAVSKLCPYTITPYLSRIFLRKNMFDHKIILPLELTSVSCGDDDNSIEGLSTFKVYSFARIRDIIQAFPNGFFTKIRLYISQTESVLFDISPASVPFWSTCPSCVGLNASNLSFSSPNLTSELTKLLRNIGRYLYSSGSETSLEVINLDPVIFGPKSIEIRTDIKHLGTNLLVINPLDFEIHYDPGTLTGTSTAYNISTDDLGFNHTPLPSFPSNFSLPIGYSSFNFSLSPTNPISSSLINLSATKINEIVLFNGGVSNTPVNITPKNIQYVEHTLIASYNVPPTIISKGWYDSLNNLLTSSDTYVTATSGTYTFKIQSSSLPLITKTVTV